MANIVNEFNILLKEKKSVNEIFDKNPKIFNEIFCNQPFIHMLYDLTINDIFFYECLDSAISKIIVYDMKLLDAKNNEGETVSKKIDNYLIQNPNFKHKEKFINIKNRLNINNNVFNLLKISYNKDNLLKLNNENYNIKLINKKIEDIIHRLELIEQDKIIELYLF
jgi:hypothetical protein